jgi:uncharacterized delta-60 repeat protein
MLCSRQLGLPPSDGLFPKEDDMDTRTSRSNRRHRFALGTPAAAAALGLAVAGVLPASAQEATDPAPSLSRLALDTSFGRGGFVQRVGRKARHTQLESITGVAIDASGRIVVCGTQSVPSGDPNSHFLVPFVPGVARFLADGRPDASFAGGGVAMLPVWSVGDVRVAVQSDGRPVVIGAFRTIGTPDDSQTVRWSAVRLTETGGLDTTFSGDGLLETSIGPSPNAFRDVRANPPDGSVLVTSERGLDAGLLRVDANGALDAAYGGSGIAVPPGSGVFDFAVDDAGRAVVGTAAGISRIAADGTLDAAFGTGGVALAADGSPVLGQVDIDADGRIVALALGDRPGLYRFLPDGTPDLTFGVAGRSPVAWGVPGRANVGDAHGIAATHGAAPRYVSAAFVTLLANNNRTPTGSGIVVQTFDPAAPRRVASLVQRLPRSFIQIQVARIAISPDGSTAVVAGSTGRYAGVRRRTIVYEPFLFRVRLDPVADVPLPDFHVYFSEAPGLAKNQFGDWMITGRMRVDNTGAGDPTGVRIAFYLSDDDVLDAGDTFIWYRAVRFSARGGVIEQPIDLSSGRLNPAVASGRRVIAVINPDGMLAESNIADDLAVSERLP